MSPVNHSIPRTPADQAFIITVGVSRAHTQQDCARALRALQRAGFECGPTSNESMKTIVHQMRLVDGLVQNDPAYEPPQGDVQQ